MNTEAFFFFGRYRFYLLNKKPVENNENWATFPFYWWFTTKVVILRFLFLFFLPPKPNSFSIFSYFNLIVRYRIYLKIYLLKYQNKVIATCFILWLVLQRYLFIQNGRVLISWNVLFGKTNKQKTKQKKKQ